MEDTVETKILFSCTFMNSSLPTALPQPQYRLHIQCYIKITASYAYMIHTKKLFNLAWLFVNQQIHC